MIQSSCGLDCFDACEFSVAEYNSCELIANTSNNTLCSLLNKELFDTPRIEKPTIDGIEVSLEEALDATALALKEKALLWRGSGNFGVMNEITNLLFEQIGGTLTKGSLCDGAGGAGIEEGRGVNRTLPIEQIQNAEVVIVWGRNISTTNSHFMPYLAGKKIVVIDPVATPIAKKADLHIQIAPRKDVYLALMLSRFIFMEDSEKIEWMDEYASEYEDFYDFTRTFRLKGILEYLELNLGDIGKLISYLKFDKVVILVGVGVQKYSIGHSVLHAIDSLASTLGLFGKEGCGVGYLGDSKLGFDNPFDVTTPRVSKVNTPFKDFKTVLVQGGNPAESMPNSKRVQKELESLETLIYFGLYHNETSKRAKIVIPAKSFLEKKDIRLSYADYKVSPMNPIMDTDIGISEYDFVKELYKKGNFSQLNKEQEYIDKWLNHCQKQENTLYSPAYQMLPYQNGFGEDEDDEFIFIDDFEDYFEDIKRLIKYRKSSNKENKKQEYWLITPKAKHSLNTQFRRDNSVHIHPDLGYENNQELSISSSYGEHKFIAKHNSDLRVDCVLITANTLGVNTLTPDTISQEGEGACYQEVKVTINAKDIL